MIFKSQKKILHTTFPSPSSSFVVLKYWSFYTKSQYSTHEVLKIPQLQEQLFWNMTTAQSCCLQVSDLTPPAHLQWHTLFLFFPPWPILTVKLPLPQSHSAFIDSPGLDRPPLARGPTLAFRSAWGPIQHATRFIGPAGSNKAGGVCRQAHQNTASSSLPKTLPLPLSPLTSSTTAAPQTIEF